ncbi:MAG TPA: glycosyltransferase [bacterium]|nr:glycosyltransferase [bacterium]
MKEEKFLKKLKEEIPLPSENAFYSFTSFQKFMIFILSVFLIYIFYLHFKKGTYLPYYIISSIYLILCFHKFFLVILGILRNKEIKVSREDILFFKDWPTYTILLPLYREKEIFPQLFRAIENIDYPKDKLEVILLLEEDDKELLEYLENWELPSWWKKIVIPNFQPKTKGKALNYGLKIAQGKYLVIYDAEDIPEPDQLKKAAVAFSKVEEDVVCLQSKLNYYNPYQNILTKWFTSEYSCWFDLYLPGIDALNAPIPLGGTSNHFKTEILKKLNGWDPFNVTEDCDLGIRIFKEGYKTKVLDTTTWEEANSKLKNWIKQRSRWVKGYIQTFFVHTRKPFSLIRKIGIVNFLHFVLIVGGNFFVLCFNPIAWVLLIIWILSPEHACFPNLFFKIVTPILLFGNAVFVMINVLGCLKRRYYRLIIPSLLSPIYWLLMSIGAWKGAFQLLKKPHFWEKTDHALFFQPVKEVLEESIFEIEEKSRLN